MTDALEALSDNPRRLELSPAERQTVLDMAMALTNSPRQAETGQIRDYRDIADQICDSQKDALKDGSAGMRLIVAAMVLGAHSKLDEKQEAFQIIKDTGLLSEEAAGVVENTAAAADRWLYLPKEDSRVTAQQAIEGAAARIGTDIAELGTWSGIDTTNLKPALAALGVGVTIGDATDGSRKAGNQFSDILEKELESAHSDAR